jgi:mannose/fructose/N-acetylgalactosamine-specific phosphotransferase system component IIC
MITKNIAKNIKKNIKNGNYKMIKIIKINTINLIYYE